MAASPNIFAMNSRQRWRRCTNYFVLMLSMFAMLLGLLALLWIVMTVFQHGGGALALTLLTEATPPPGMQGGLGNAIVGSLLMVGMAMLVGTPIGILTGIYLAEYGRHSLLGKTVSFINDLQLSTPSIVSGVFIYSIYITWLGHFSAFAGALALAILVVPVVIGITASTLALVPDSLREAAFALGAPQWKVIQWVTLRAARASIMTGVLLAMARIAGETAPLLFTALSSPFWSMDINQPMANLPVTIFRFAMSPFTHWQELAWAGVLLIMFTVLLINILTRVVFRQERPL